MKAPFYVLLFTVLLSCAKQELSDEKEVQEKAELDVSVAAAIPHIYITTKNNEAITSKDNYLTGEINIDGQGKYSDLSKRSMRIKGRGNTTWQKPKKPYRIKLDNAAAVLGLSEAKDWVLLANHQDYTFMTNAIAMKLGKQLNMPFTNNIIAVDVTVNNVYQGVYNLTEQIEVKEERIDVGDDGVLLELDSYFDEDYKFKSTLYDLPVNIKEPEIESTTQFDAIKKDFENLETLIYGNTFPNNNYGDYFDKQQFVNYLLLSNLVNNSEINHPKSVYMHKSKNGKYTMGPIWDFDWAFGYNENTGKYFHSPNAELIKANDDRPGANLWKRLLSDPEIKTLYKQTWNNYKSHKLDALLEYCEYFSAKIRNSHLLDHGIWQVGSNDLAEHKKNMKIFLRKRANYIDEYVERL